MKDTLAKAFELWRAGDRAGAIRICEGIYTQNPTPEVGIHLIGFFREEGELARARTLAGELEAKLRFALAQTCFQAALVARDCGDDEDARRLGREAVRMGYARVDRLRSELKGLADDI